MTELSRLERPLRNILWELRLYVPDLVIVGGWVPHLYRVYGGFQAWTSEVPFTSELDVLVRTRLPRVGDETIPEILTHAGFEPVGGDRAAAAWAKGAGAGEKVEFLIAHTGTARQRGQVVPVSDQEGLGAISLDGLDLLRRHTSVLRVPLGRHEGALRDAEVNVPRLGIYAVNKAVTFPQRSPFAGEVVNPKRAKDLLYLRDLMAAGEEVLTRIEDDIRHIARSDASAAEDTRTACNNMGLALNGTLQRTLPDVAEAVSVRFGVSQEEALSDVRGHLTDFWQVLRDVLDG
jgi:Nucleotidyltransferase